MIFLLNAIFKYKTNVLQNLLRSLLITALISPLACSKSGVNLPDPNESPETEESLLSENLPKFFKKTVNKDAQNLRQLEEQLETLGLKFKIYQENSHEGSELQVNWDIDYFENKIVSSPKNYWVIISKTLSSYRAHTMNFIDKYGAPYLLRDTSSTATIVTPAPEHINLLKSKLYLTEKLIADISQF